MKRVCPLDQLFVRLEFKITCLLVAHFWVQVPLDTSEEVLLVHFDGYGPTTGQKFIHIYPWSQWP